MEVLRQRKQALRGRNLPGLNEVGDGDAVVVVLVALSKDSPSGPHFFRVLLSAPVFGLDPPTINHGRDSRDAIAPRGRLGSCLHAS